MASLIAKKGEEHYESGTQYNKYYLIGQSNDDEIDLFYIESGEVSITPSAADTVTTGAIAFTNEFVSAPVIVITPKSTVPNKVTCGVSDITTTGANIYMTRKNTTATVFEWIAIGHKKP